MYEVTHKSAKNKSCVFHGIVFDSKKEGGHYRQFEIMKEQGKIKDFHKQVLIEFYLESRIEKTEAGDIQIPPLVRAKVRLNNVYLNEVQPTLFTKKLCQYKCDFLVEHNGELLNDGVMEFVEVKGRESFEWKRGWDLLEACYGLDPKFKLSIIK